jgi:hypothetical protein
LTGNKVGASLNFDLIVGELARRILGMRVTILAAIFLFPGLVWAGWRQGQYGVRLAPPPLPGSAQDIADRQELLSDQAQRTDLQCEQAEAMAKASFKLFKPALNQAQYRHVHDVMKAVAKLAADEAKRQKEVFQRPRPAREEPRLHTCSGLETDGYSYPSSHATVASSVACLLERLYPPQAKSLAEFAHGIGELRVIAGYHHPSDIAAGEALGAAICRQLLDDSDFQKEFSAL